MKARHFPLIALFASVLVVGILILWAWTVLNASLPTLSGEVKVSSVSAPVQIERDALGIPTVDGDTLLDVTFALGFLHAQDRFFQMDLSRRSAAGELAALFGSKAVEHDRKVRIHQFRDRAEQVVASASTWERELLEIYVAGVNAGLDALGARPFEYFALRSEPEPWTEADTVLAAYTFSLQLQANYFEFESALGAMRDLLPEPLYAFLSAPGSEWDTPVEGELFTTPDVPGPEVISLNARSPNSDRAPARCPRSISPRPVEATGSNNWAVAGTNTRHGGPIVADDMHLAIRVPNTWYRATLTWSDGAAPDGRWQITGASFPGLPAILVGSNRHVAWGFTNARGDWSDQIVLELDPENPQVYRTPNGSQSFIRHLEVIEVKGAESVEFEVDTTIWGPVFDTDHQGRKRVLRWVAHDPEALNFRIVKLATATTLEESLRLANESGGAHQNIVIADKNGHIGWTIFGRIPRRVGLSGRVPTSWANGSRRWDGYLNPSEYPRIVDPADGRIWTANARVVGGEELGKIGFGGYDQGARARQIRNRLLALDKATEQDMLDIQLDDEAQFLARWQRLILDVLAPSVVNGNDRRSELRGYVETWDGHASINSVGYRLVVDFRERIVCKVLGSLTSIVGEKEPRFHVGLIRRQDGMVWKILTEQPSHLLTGNYRSWEDLLLKTVDQTLDAYFKIEPSLANRSWGELNTTRIQHPLSRAIPILGDWLNMPEEPLPGARRDIPRIQSTGHGASERMVVSPGREELGIFHMPGGQSGHPLSAHYRDGHDAWARGKPTPFLPGPSVHLLRLVP